MVERRTATPETIRAVALELFCQRGYAATSLREIAERLRMTKAAVYHHVASKEDMLSGLVAEYIAELDPLLAWARDRPDGVERRRELLHRYGALVAGRFGRLVSFLAENRGELRGMAAPDAAWRREDELCGLLADGTSPMDLMRARLCLAALRMGTEGPDGASPTDRRDAALELALELAGAPAGRT